MDNYLNNEMMEALQMCDFASKDDEAIRQILMHERVQRNSLSANDRDTIVQYDRIVAASVDESEV